MLVFDNACSDLLYHVSVGAAPEVFLAPCAGPPASPLHPPRNIIPTSQRVANSTDGKRP
jgi:hypothetical protein